jgi:hypothetical protein
MTTYKLNHQNYYLNNKEKILKKLKEYYQKNKIKSIEYAKKYQQIYGNN